MKTFSLLVIVSWVFSIVSAYAEGGTIWTKEFPNSVVEHVVFAPDGNSIFFEDAVGFSINYQYDLLGNYISESSKRFIERFSDDGNYFYDYLCNKVDYSSLEYVASLHNSNYLSGSSVYDLSESKNVGVMCFGLAENSLETDSNFYFFTPFDLKVTDKITHPGTIPDSSIWFLTQIAISPDGKKAAMCVRNKLNKGTFLYDEEYLEIWDIPSKTIDKSIFFHETNYHRRSCVKYSPDGKLLGYTKSDTLFIYNADDMTLVHLKDYSNIEYGIRSILFSSDYSTLYVGSRGLEKIDLSTFAVVSTFNSAKGATSIVESKDRKVLAAICEYGTKLVVLDNSYTGIQEEYEQNYSLAISPSPASTEIHINIESNECATMTYSISNISGGQVYELNSIELNPGMISFKVNVASLPSGLYLFNTIIDGQTKSYKFVVDR